jgi:hypothetical protein
MKGFAMQLQPDNDLPLVLQPVVDVIRDVNGKITQGLVIGATQPQNEALILISNPGEFKNSPSLGVGLGDALLGDTDDLLRYRHEVRRCYRLEGLEVEKLDLFNINKVNIKAKYR